MLLSELFVCCTMNDTVYDVKSVCIFGPEVKSSSSYFFFLIIIIIQEWQVLKWFDSLFHRGLMSILKQTFLFRWPIAMLKPLWLWNLGSKNQLLALWWREVCDIQKILLAYDMKGISLEIVLLFHVLGLSYHLLAHELGEFY